MASLGEGNSSTDWHRTCDVSGAEEELGLVVGEERRMAASLLLVQTVNLALKLFVGRDAAWLACNLLGNRTSITANLAGKCTDSFFRPLPVHLVIAYNTLKQAEL